MRIAVIVPAFNIGPFLGDCLSSLLQQTFTDWSAVVVDDGSTDDTSEVAGRFPADRVCVVRQHNAGVSAARNTGISLVLQDDRRRVPRLSNAGCRFANPLRPDALLFLDGDDWLAPAALEVLAETLALAPCAVAACGRYSRVAADGATRLAPKPPDGHLLEQLLSRNLFANGGHVLIRREAVEAVGGFRTDLTYGEDWEFWTRIALQGEFVAARSHHPLLFVRERFGSAYLSSATDPTAYEPAVEAIYRNPDVANRLGCKQAADLRRRADAETAWSVGRELIRHGDRGAGLTWLRRSIRSAPSLRRIILMALSRLPFGLFRPYRKAC